MIIIYLSTTNTQGKISLLFTIFGLYLSIQRVLLRSDCGFIFVFIIYIWTHGTFRKQNSEVSEMNIRVVCCESRELVPGQYLDIALVALGAGQYQPCSGL